MTRTSPGKTFDWANLMFGGMLALSPLLPAFSDRPTAIWNALLAASLVAACSAVALAKPAAWIDWLVAGTGGWLIIAPTVLGFWSNPAALWIHAVIGVTLIFLGGLQIISRHNTKTATGTR